MGNKEYIERGALLSEICGNDPSRKERGMIKLNDEYSVDVTPNSYNLVHFEGFDKNGKERWIAVGYYASIDSAVRNCIEKMTKRKLMKIDCDLSQALRIIEEQKLCLNEMLGKVGLTDDR